MIEEVRPRSDERLNEVRRCEDTTERRPTRDPSWEHGKRSRAQLVNDAPHMYEGMAETVQRTQMSWKRNDRFPNVRMKG